MRKYGFVKPLILIPLDTFFLWFRNLTTLLSYLICLAYQYISFCISLNVASKCLYFKHQTEIRNVVTTSLTPYFKKSVS